MMEDAAAAVAPALADGWVIWEVPGKPVSVWLSPDVAGRLRMAVWAGFKSLPRRGLETGGLLIGIRREMGDRVVVYVDDFEPVESEHASGPSYVLSDADLRMLQARIAAREPAVVGFYRSHTRPDFAITVEDASLFSTHFGKASDVFLLIKPNDDGTPTGGFIIREGGKVLSNNPYAEFPLPVITVKATAREARVPALPIAQAPPRAATKLPPTAPPRTARMVTRPVWLATAAVVTIGVALSTGIGGRSSALIPAKAGLSLALNVTNAGNSLRLSWNRQLSRRAGNAALWIKDGPEEQRFELDSKQLSEGSVVYWPKSVDVNFRLELFSPGANVSESIRAIGGPSKPPVDVPEPPRTAVPAPRALPPTGAGPLQDTVRPPTLPRPDRTGTASRQLPRPFALPQAEPASARVDLASLPDPPTIPPAVSPAPEPNEEILKQIVPASSPGFGNGADPRVRVSVEPVSVGILEHLGRNIPLIGKRYRRADYVPPSPLHYPALPQPPQSNLAKHVSIDVKVNVNPAGKVDYVEVLSKVANTDRDLAALAMFSARRWEFIPARTGDGKVPGAVILHYQFGPVAPVPVR